MMHASSKVMGLRPIENECLDCKILVDVNLFLTTKEKESDDGLCILGSEM